MPAGTGMGCINMDEMKRILNSKEQTADGASQLEAAMNELHRFVMELSQKAGQSEEQGEQLWQDETDPGV